MGTHPGRSLPMLELGTLTLGLRVLKIGSNVLYT